MTAKKAYTLREIVERGLLPVSERTLRRMIASGKLKAADVGAGGVPRWSVPASEIQRLQRSSRR